MTQKTQHESMDSNTIYTSTSKLEKSEITTSSLSIAIEGWMLAKQAFKGLSPKKRLKEQTKYFFRFLFNSKFASHWLQELRSAKYQQITQHRNLLFTKPFREYISTEWTLEQKSKAIFDTYRFILSKEKGFLDALVNEQGLEIARFSLTETCQAWISLCYDSKHTREGEFVLTLRCDLSDDKITTASLSFEETAPEHWVCRIGSVQGHKINDQNTSKIVQKHLHGLRPKSLIVLAVQEFSRQLGLNAIYGVGDTIHPYRKIRTIFIPSKHGIQFDYDALWLETGGTPIGEGWYELPLVPVHKTYEEIKTHKRAVYRRRYALCDDIASQISNAISSFSTPNAVSKTNVHETVIHHVPEKTQRKTAILEPQID